jgi:hypothetical protein
VLCPEDVPYRVMLELGAYTFGEELRSVGRICRAELDAEPTDTGFVRKVLPAVFSAGREDG